MKDNVILVDDDSENIGAVLGISKEKQKAFDKIIMIALVSNDTHTDAFVEISNKCEHINEFAYCMFHYSAQVGKTQTMASLMERLKK